MIRQNINAHIMLYNGVYMPYLLFFCKLIQYFSHSVMKLENRWQKSNNWIIPSLSFLLADISFLSPFSPRPSFLLISLSPSQLSGISPLAGISVTIVTVTIVPPSIGTHHRYMTTCTGRQVGVASDYQRHIMNNWWVRNNVIKIIM